VHADDLCAREDGFEIGEVGAVDLMSERIVGKDLHVEAAESGQHPAADRTE
jgi:hypothetical protein